MSRRPPRVMHGMAAMMQQAANAAQAPILQRPTPAQITAADIAALREFSERGFKRLQEAELKLTRVEHVITALEGQLVGRNPQEDTGVALLQTVLKSFRDALNLGPRPEAQG